MIFLDGTAYEAGYHRHGHNWYIVWWKILLRCVLDCFDLFVSHEMRLWQPNALQERPAVSLRASGCQFRVSGCQCQSLNNLGFDPSILLHSGIWGLANEAVLNNINKKLENPKNPPFSAVKCVPVTTDLIFKRFNIYPRQREGSYSCFLNIYFIKVTIYPAVLSHNISRGHYFSCKNYCLMLAWIRAVFHMRLFNFCHDASSI